MPNLDGGHYFLTALSPVLAEPVARQDGSVTSPTATLREALASLPTAVQSEACIDSGHCSPFARCHRTHLARLVVIDQPSFNGRDSADSILQAVRKTDLLQHGPVDTLTRAWLLLAVDFDAGDGPDHGLNSYLTGLWALMSEELREVYRFCHGFEAVKDAESFADYITRCQVETTMPFNDYWTTPLNLPTLSLGLLIGLVGGITAGAGLALWLALHVIGAGGGWALIGLPAGLALGLWAAYRLILARGLKTFPTAPGSDLKTILKALHGQQAFARFAVANQGASPQALHDAFGAFLDAGRLDDLMSPTQAPGVIQS